MANINNFFFKLVNLRNLFDFLVNKAIVDNTEIKTKLSTLVSFKALFSNEAVWN